MSYCFTWTYGVLTCPRIKRNQLYLCSIRFIIVITIPNLLKKTEFPICVGMFYVFCENLAIKYVTKCI